MRFAFLFLFSAAASALFAQKTYEFKNGNWFNGTEFVPATWYSVGGKLSKKAPAQIDSVVDLTDRFVIPPLGDAFSSSLADHPTPEMQLKSYLNEGIFYIQTLGNTREGRQKVTTKLSASTPDVSFANGEITCTLGEPFMRYEPAALGIKNPNEITKRTNEIKTKRAGLGDGYWFIDNKDALSANWSKIKAQNPGVISITLLDAENTGGKEGKGLTPDVAKALVKKAHKSDLKVFARVENANDVRLAVKLGVDGIAGLPGNQWNGEGSTAAFDLSDADLKLLAKKKTIVIPVFTKAQSMGAPKPAVTAYQSALLRRMLASGVLVAIGSDDPQRTIRSEVTYWFNLGDLNLAAALRALCETTPQAIFPERKIGRFENGYEASFLVLPDNPLNNFLKMRAIQFKVKNGVVLK
jgi:hypothetical protein